MRTLVFDPTVLNIAHRGARAVAPENTLPAARIAHRNGAHMWELDVAVSRDGVPVVIHDDTLQRTSNVKEVFPQRWPWRVDGFTLEELRALDFGSWFLETDPFGQVRAGSVGEEEGRGYGQLRISTLQEALVMTRELEWLVNVEIKSLAGTVHSAHVAQRVMDIIRATGMRERTLVSSFHHDYLRQVRNDDADIALGVLVNSSVADPIGLVREIGAQSYHPHTNAIELDEIGPLRESGIQVLVWVVNEKMDMRRYVDAGISGLFTDFPQRLNEVLRE